MLKTDHVYSPIVATSVVRNNWDVSLIASTSTLVHVVLLRSDEGRMGICFKQIVIHDFRHAEQRQVTSSRLNSIIACCHPFDH